MIGVAALACRRGRFDDSSRLLVAIDAMLSSIGAAMKPNEQRLYERTKKRSQEPPVGRARGQRPARGNGSRRACARSREQDLIIEP